MTLHVPESRFRDLWLRSLTGARSSQQQRWERWRSKSWQVGQCAIAAGLAWLIAADLLHHPIPIFAPIAAIICLGTSYGQRLSRVLEVTVGVAVGVLVGDGFVLLFGSGWWQIMLMVAVGMSVALWLSPAGLIHTQAAVQAIVVSILAVEPGQAMVRWIDAVIGGAVALVAATLVPAAPLRRPREQAARVVDKIAELLTAAADVMRAGELEAALELLAEARSTDYLIRELADAADEGLDVVAASPFRRRHRSDLRRLVELTEPLDRALRNTRVLVRNCALASYKQRPVPKSYWLLAEDLATATGVVASELRANRIATAAREPLLLVGAASAAVERTDVLVADVILGTMRAIVSDLLMVTGLDQFESTDALPPVQEGS